MANTAGVKLQAGERYSTKYPGYIRRADGSKKNKRGRTADSHILVKCGNHPAAKKGFVPEHRLVMESMLGRYLSPEERVHHINCIKSDNRPENLVLCKDDREHFLAHGSLNKCVEALIEAGVLLFDREEMQYRVNAESLKGQAVADAILIARHGASCA